MQAPIPILTVLWFSVHAAPFQRVYCCWAHIAGTNLRHLAHALVYWRDRLHQHINPFWRLNVLVYSAPWQDTPGGRLPNTNKPSPSNQGLPVLNRDGEMEVPGCWTTLTRRQEEGVILTNFWPEMMCILSSAWLSIAAFVHTSSLLPWWWLDRSVETLASYFPRDHEIWKLSWMHVHTELARLPTLASNPCRPFVSLSEGLQLTQDHMYL